MSIRILVADDDLLMRTLITVSLSDIAETIEASDGGQAMTLFEENEFDLIILDWEMPGMSGLDVLKAIRARRSRVPIIMVTAKAEREQILQALHVGASDYLIKPFEIDALREKLKKLRRSAEAV